MKNSRDAVIVSACRTALGTFNGGLSGMPATTLGGLIINEAISRASIKKEDVDEVIMSQVLPCGCGQNPARQAMVKAGLPWETGAVTINKVCGGGLKAIMLAAQAVKCNDADIVIAGGMETMSLAPFYLEKARFGYRMGNSQLIDSMVHDGLWDIVNDFHMGISNDLISEKYKISREDQDRYAAMSYERAVKCVEEGRFKDEIMPVEIPGRKGQTVIFDTDEGPRETTYEALAKMKPAFQKEGFATAGNASIIADGAAAVCVMSREKAEALGCKPLATIMAYGSSGLDMKYVLIAPIHSIPKVLKRAGMDIKDIDLHEVNEAFSGSTVCCMRELGLTSENVNVNGGSVAIGHPIGASGARVLTTLLYEMEKRDVKTGEASLCLGGGEAVTMIVQR
ncbi:MAG: acetyl-CoA C-acetyltransferase [bacterium]